jgi:hypothetical protein
MTQTQTAPQYIPDSLKAFAGQMMDIDTHEMTPAEIWVREFGEDARDIAETFMNVPRFNPEVDSSIPGYKADDVPITPESVWRMKGSLAPGAVDLARRIEIMDRIGVKRQLMFPSGVAIYGSWLANWPVEYGFLKEFKGDRQAWAYRLWEAHNQYCIRMLKISERIRPVAALWGDSPKEIIDRARRLIDAGVRAFWIFSSRPPGGVSPAHEDLDPMWKLMTAHECTPTLHVGSDGNYVKNDFIWSKARAFEGYKLGTEFNLSPWHTSTNHLAAQNFLATCTVGGVFERHPALRFGVIELGAYWVGHIAETLDLWHTNNSQFGSVKSNRLPNMPSYYINRNVRVTPFDFEPVDQYFERYAGLQDIYCFSSDYPHLEGGRDSMHRFAARLERLGPAIMKKFFVTNGAYLLPD